MKSARRIAANIAKLPELLGRKVPRRSLSMAGLRQQLAIGQQLKQRVPAQIRVFHALLCFDFSTTDAQIVAGGSLHESCQKTENLPKFRFYQLAALVPSAGTFLI